MMDDLACSIASVRCVSYERVDEQALEYELVDIVFSGGVPVVWLMEQGG